MTLMDACEMMNPVFLEMSSKLSSITGTSLSLQKNIDDSFLLRCQKRVLQNQVISAYRSHILSVLRQKSKLVVQHIHTELQSA